MKLSFINVWFIGLLLFTSCLKDKESEPGEVEIEEEVLIKAMDAKRSMEISRFFVSETEIEDVYPGKIVKFIGEGEEYNFEGFNDYKKLPIVTSSMRQKRGSFYGMPTFKNTSEFIRDNISMNGGGISLAFQSWQKFLDFHSLNMFLENRLEREKFYEILSDYTEVKTSLYYSLINNKFEITMDLPNEADLISIIERRRIKKRNLKIYYINQVTYGDFLFLVGQSQFKKEVFQPILVRVTQNEALTADEIKVLDQSSLSVYLRSSNRKESLIKNAKGSKAILNLVKEYNDLLNTKEEKNEYPLHFTLSDLQSHDMLMHKFDYKFKVDANDNYN